MQIGYTLVLVFLLFIGANAQKNSDGFRFIDHFDKKQIDVLYNGKLLTAYYYADSIKKPVLFPINTLTGSTITRGFPIKARPGERVDHPHHTGLWLNYESVNGLDFWNNSTAIPFSKRPQYGTIVHQAVEKTTTGKKEATLEVSARWIDHYQKEHLTEKTRYTFLAEGENFIIDRSTTLQASQPVVFKDVKDGFLGLRVARELEHPSNQPETFVDTKGNYTAVPVVNNDGVTGLYLSSEGITGNEVWSTRAKWVTLSGIINRQDVSVTIIDHPNNIGYPTYWHARGYGLFAANPLGRAVFSPTKESLNLQLNKDNSITFQYRIVIRGGSKITPAEINKLAKAFAK